MNWRSPTIVILAGQLVWAIAQAILSIQISRHGGLEMFGAYILALSILSPINLAVGLNLRNRIAIDESRSLDIQLSLITRLMGATASMVATLLLIFPFTNYAYSILILVSLKLMDQTADLISGYFQREGRHARIGVSYGARGAGVAIPFLVTTFLGGNIEAAALMALLVGSIVHIWIDVYPVISSEPRNIRGGHGTAREKLSKIASLKNLSTLPYPFLDTIFFNSFRYAIGGLLSSGTLGVLGVVQTFYAPVQLVVTALGYTYLSRSRDVYRQNSKEKYVNLYYISLFGSFCCGMAFTFAIWIIPKSLLEDVFKLPVSIDRQTLVVMALAFTFLPMAGFASLTSMARQDFRTPVIAVITSIITFMGLILTIFSANGQVTLESIVISFVAASALRLLISQRGISKNVK